MADETKYKKRPTRKVIRTLRMPASARGGYDVPEEATWEDEEEVAPYMEIDPVTGEEYIPRGIEEAAGPEDIADPAQVKSALKKTPLVLGMLKRMKLPKIDPKTLPLESTVRTPLAVVDTQFAKKAMNPEEEALRRQASDYLEAKNYPKEKRAEAIKDYAKKNTMPSSSEGYALFGRSPIEDSTATKTLSNRAYVSKSIQDVGPERAATHEGAHKLLNPIESISYKNVTAQEKILNEQIPENVRAGLDALLDRYGYPPESRQKEYIPWLTNLLNKQVSKYQASTNPEVQKIGRGITREVYEKSQREARELHPYKKEMMRAMDWEEEQYNNFLKDARKAYDSVAKRAETLTPEELAKVEKEMLEAASTKKAAKVAPSSEVAAIRPAAPDIEEDLEPYMAGMKRANPELGEDAKPPSVLRKLRDKYSDMMQEWKASRPEARRKLQERLDNLKLLQEQEEERLKKEAIDTMEREERRKNVRFVPPTQIIGDK